MCSKYNNQVLEKKGSGNYESSFMGNTDFNTEKEVPKQQLGKGRLSNTHKQGD